FSSDEHPQYHTHMNFVRPKRVIPVLLTDHIPRLNKSAEEDERWYRLMLILFKPWRTISDLLGDASNWKSAFESYTFSKRSMFLMHNMNIESECRDARDDARRT
ncbi:hypothetical protein BJ138DRAFT_991661, partial [Hygrophoropsis aurantiaca]